MGTYRRDEGDHEGLGKTIDLMPKRPTGPGTELKELRTARNTFDYSPYPGPDDRSTYDATTIKAMIERSLETAENLVRAFEKRCKERR
jgi:hypothetical protein